MRGTTITHNPMLQKHSFRPCITSVPGWVGGNFYLHIHRLIDELSKDMACEKCQVYDLIQKTRPLFKTTLVYTINSTEQNSFINHTEWFRLLFHKCCQSSVHGQENTCQSDSVFIPNISLVMTNKTVARSCRLHLIKGRFLPTFVYVEKLKLLSVASRTYKHWLIYTRIYMKTTAYSTSTSG